MPFVLWTTKHMCYILWWLDGIVDGFLQHIDLYLKKCRQIVTLDRFCVLKLAEKKSSTVFRMCTNCTVFFLDVLVNFMFALKTVSVCMCLCLSVHPFREHLMIAFQVGEYMAMVCVYTQNRWIPRRDGDHFYEIVVIGDSKISTTQKGSLAKMRFSLA